MSRRFDLCFVGLKCYDVLAGKPVPKYLGGIERVFVALAKSMSASGLDVAFVTYDEGQDDVEVHDGITVLKAHDADAGVPVLRLLHPRMTAVWRAMRSANARYYLQMGAGVETFAVAAGVRAMVRNGSRFVYCVASNLDCEKELRGIDSRHERLLYPLGLRRAHHVVAQTESQAAMLRSNFGLEARVIAMPFEALAPGADGEAAADETLAGRRLLDRAEAAFAGFDVLWVGRVVEPKRLEWLLELAELMPEATFHVVGTANKASDYSRNLVARATRLANVRVHGRLSQQDLAAFYAGAFVLCCTSSVEGFPTTFLEAWKVGVPVVSTFDPDGIIERRQAGVAVDSVGELRSAILELRSDRDRYVLLSRNAAELYREQYAPDAIVRRYVELLSVEPPGSGA